MKKENKKKAMTKEQMKEYFYSIIEDYKRQITTCESLEETFTKRKEEKGLNENETNILKFTIEDKWKLKEKRYNLEEMFENMFAIDYFDYQWNKKQESEEM